ncbi:MAG: ATP-binding protein [Bacteroidetes bacterium]|nr:ATP-binding protein [Bacteroidota bacterium]
MSRIFKEIRIPCSTEGLTKVENFVDDICEAYYITNSYYGNILMAVLEAVKNAMIHGNKNNPEKVVRLSFKSVPNGLCFTVKDQGDGFDFRNVPNPLEADEKVAEIVGRGIFLIRSLADRVSYNAKGNVVEIIFFISSINQETTLNRISQIHRYFNKQKSLA